jgi:hypothetical protein
MAAADWQSRFSDPLGADANGVALIIDFIMFFLKGGGSGVKLSLLYVCDFVNFYLRGAGIWSLP